MYNYLPDILRKISVETLFKAETFQKCWDVWRPNVKHILGPIISEDDIINLGDRLSNIFKTTGGSGRGQSELSGGGQAWESLVCWYINLCTVGSRIVAFKKMSLVPSAIRDAITVNYGNYACNTESDITVVIFPDSHDYKTDIGQLETRGTNGKIIPVYKRNKFNTELIDFLIKRDFSQCQIGIIQCKTNWNDNAQIPMLWDMIYSAGGFRGRNITIGRNNFSIGQSPNFTYSFVTVPSNQHDLYRPDTLAVKRVTNLSGGNYWGQPTLPDVARSLKEIFVNNYNLGFKTTIRADIRTALPNFSIGLPLDYFRIA